MSPRAARAHRVRARRLLIARPPPRAREAPTWPPTARRYTTWIAEPTTPPLRSERGRCRGQQPPSAPRSPRLALPPRPPRTRSRSLRRPRLLFLAVLEA